MVGLRQVRKPTENVSLHVAPAFTIILRDVPEDLVI
jgi:hypothetical protein